MKHIAKAYSIKPIRLTFKFMVCLAGVKIIGDYLYSLTAGFNTTFPRCVSIALMLDIFGIGNTASA